MIKFLSVLLVFVAFSAEAQTAKKSLLTDMNNISLSSNFGTNTRCDISYGNNYYCTVFDYCSKISTAVVQARSEGKSNIKLVLEPDDSGSAYTFCTYHFRKVVTKKEPAPVINKEVRITSENLKSYSFGELFDCKPGGVGEKWGFETSITLNDGETVTARTCMDGPVGHRKAQESMMKNLTRIKNNETSFEKNASQIVCFKTVASLSTSSKLMIFDQHLVKCP